MSDLLEDDTALILPIRARIYLEIYIMKKAILPLVAVFATAYAATVAGAQEPSDLQGLMDNRHTETSILLAVSQKAEKCMKKCQEKYEYCLEENEEKGCGSQRKACEKKCE
jgi:hypothetical protein